MVAPFSLSLGLSEGAGKLDSAGGWYLCSDLVPGFAVSLFSALFVGVMHSLPGKVSVHGQIQGESPQVQSLTIRLQSFVIMCEQLYYYQK